MRITNVIAQTSAADKKIIFVKDKKLLILDPDSDTAQLRQQGKLLHGEINTPIFLETYGSGPSDYFKRSRQCGAFC